MRISSLRSFLQSLCCNSPWNYAGFWKLKDQPEMFLAWEDGFCDSTKHRDSVVPIEDFYIESSDNVLCSNINSRLLYGSPSEYPIGLAVAEMSSASHVFGKGVVGVAAFTGVPQWIYSDTIASDEFDSVFASEYPDEWLLQFVAGIKTILLLPVIPHGVLQLGSVERVAEDAMLVSFLRENFESYKRCDGYDTISPIQKISLIPTDLDNFEKPSITTTNNRNEDEKDIQSNGSKACNIFVADQMVPAFMVQDMCNPFLSHLTDSYENLIDYHSRLQPLDHLTSEDNKSEVSENVRENVRFKPSSHTEKVRAFPHSDNFHWMKHGEFVNDLSEFNFEEGSMEPNSFGNDFVYDCESGSTLLSIPSDCELHKALGPAVEGYTNHIYDSPISSHYAFWRSINERDLTYWMDLSGGESAAFTQKVDEMKLLLETVIADACSRTDDNSPNQPNSAMPLKLPPGKFLASSTKIRNKLKLNASGEDNRAPCNFFASAFTGINTGSGSASSIKSTMTELVDKQQLQHRKGNHSGNPRKGSRLSSTHKRNLCTANNQMPRPRDRQLIQDRIKELRDLVPNSDKCSIDGLLDKTIKHMLFLKDVTNQADKLRHQVLNEGTKHDTAKTAEDNRVHKNGTSWAVELGNEHHQCPIVVKDLDHPGQMLIEMLCNDHDRFLEIADVIQRLQLTILKAVMEKCSENSWAHFIVEATGSFQRLDIFWPLMQLLQHPIPIGSKTTIQKIDLLSDVFRVV